MTIMGRGTRRGQVARIGLWFVLIGFVAGSVWLAQRLRFFAPSIETVETVTVRRTDLETQLLVGGELQSSKITTVTCEVEDLSASSFMGMEPGTPILELVENGTSVKKGDVLCRLDSSQLEELVRQQRIELARTRSEHREAQLTHEVAETALRESREGLHPQRRSEIEGRLKLLEADLSRQQDRLNWAEAMEARGYASHADTLIERESAMRAMVDRHNAQSELKAFESFTRPKEIAALVSEIEKASALLEYQSLRLKSAEDRLAHLEKQVKACVILAPHDGMAVHCGSEYWQPIFLERGTRVQQNQDLFYLPDMSQMEVNISIHESVAPRVKVGMKATIFFPAFPDRPARGTVSWISQLSLPDWQKWNPDLRHFPAKVRLDELPQGLLPTMSASAEIETGRVENCLAIPLESIQFHNGRAFCTVLSRGVYTRRELELGRGSQDLREVESGLSEGEQIVLRPEELASAGESRESSKEGESLGWIE